MTVTAAMTLPPSQRQAVDVRSFILSSPHNAQTSILCFFSVLKSGWTNTLVSVAQRRNEMDSHRLTIVAMHTHANRWRWWESRSNSYYFTFVHTLSAAIKRWDDGELFIVTHSVQTQFIFYNFHFVNTHKVSIAGWFCAAPLKEWLTLSTRVAHNVFHNYL